MIVPGPIEILVFALAIARLTGLVTTDEITRALRTAILAKLDDRPATAGATVAYLLTCSWCCSMWVAAAVAPFLWWHATNPLAAIPALILALSQVTGMLSDLGR